MFIDYLGLPHQGSPSFLVPAVKLLWKEIYRRAPLREKNRHKFDFVIFFFLIRNYPGK